MAWQTIDLSLLNGEGVAGTILWYRDDDPVRPGDLSLWINPNGQVARFELTYRPAIGQPELFAFWESGYSLHTGEIESSVRGPRLYAPSPGVRRRALSPHEIATLRAYVAANGAALTPTARTAVFDALVSISP